MKIYLINNENEAKQISQLLKLNAECAKLHWSKPCQIFRQMLFHLWRLLNLLLKKKFIRFVTRTHVSVL